MDLLNEGHGAANIQEHIGQMVYFPIRQIWEKVLSGVFCNWLNQQYDQGHD